MPPKNERSRASSGPGLFTSTSPLAPISDRVSFSSMAASASGATVTVDPDYVPVREVMIASYACAPGTMEEQLDLNLGNYRRWERRVYTTLKISGGLHRYLLPTHTYPPNARPADIHRWDLNDEHVSTFLRIQCSPHENDQIDANISKECTAAALWAFLHARHINRGTHAQVFLLRDLLSLRFDPELSLSTQATDAMRTVAEVIAMGVLDTETLGKLIILNMLSDTLPNVQSFLADAISRATKASPFLVADCVQRLELETSFAAEARAARLRSDVALAAQNIALAAQSVPSRRDMICSNCKRKGHPVAECFQPGGAAEHRKQEILDRIAARRRGGTSSKPSSGPGRAYIAAAAPATGPSSTSGVAPTNDTAHSAVFDHTASLATDTIDPAWLSAHDCSYSALDGHVSSVDWALNSAAVSRSSVYSEPFLFDSGATAHVSPLRSDFTSFQSIPPRGIRGVNGSVIYAVGSGRINLAVGSGQILTLENALFVPDATVRLISVRALCDGPQAYSVDFSATAVTVRFRGGSVFFTGSRIGLGLFALSGPSAPVSVALHASSVPTIETWHRRLGHANYRATHAVATRIKASGTPVNTSLPPPKCDSCILGKQARTPVPKVREGVRSSERGATFFVDAAGDQCTVSSSGNVAPLDIIDDFSSYGWSIPVPSRAHCAPRLRDFLIARRAEGCPVRRIVMDRGECLTVDIKAVCAALGVSCETTASYTSAQNGKVERLHRTYMGKARAMRLASGVPEVRWDEFYVTACYLTNRTPTSTLPSGVTPYEAWFGKPPSLSHLREIGCRAFVLINTHNPKLRARSFECVLVGYGIASKTYRCYHPPTRRVVESYHVTFIESHESATPSIPRIPTPVSSPPLPVAPSPSCSPPTWCDDPPFAPTVPHTCPPPPPSLVPHTSSVADSVAPLSADAVPAITSASIAPVAAHDPVTASKRVRRPSQRAAESAGLPFLSSVERAVAASRESAKRIHAAKSSALDSLPEETYSAIDLALIASLQIDGDYAGDPATLREAMASPYAPQWTAAINDEFGSIREMQVYELIPRTDVPSGRKVMQGRLLFKLKRDENGDPARFKARWVIRGFQAVYGQDYHRTTSPTMRMESFRILLHLAASLNWELLQLDVKTAFLYGLLPPDEVCYMEQPKGFEEPGKEEFVWRLRKGLYGMPQGGRTWNRTMHEHLTSVGFLRLECEYCLYFRTTSEGTVITGVHVDDFIAIASSVAAGDLFKADLRRAWSISDLGEARFCVGIAIARDRPSLTIRISQTALIDRVISQFNLDDCFPVSTPMVFGDKLSRSQAASSDDDKRTAATWPYRALVGSLMYIAVGSRPDISFAVQQLAQFMESYGHAHWEAAKRVVRYLKGTRELALTLGGDRPAFILGYTDSDWAGCVNTRRSTSGYCFSLGSGMVSWSARKQPSPSDSSCEAEYVAAAEAGKECVWIRAVMSALGFSPTEGSPLLVDNRSAITLSGDPSFHSRSKHIAVKHHILRHYTNTDQVCVLWIPTKDNIADIFTKALPGPQFVTLRHYLGLQ